MPYDHAAFEEYFRNPPVDIDMAELNLQALPQHIAVIMDGNGRWAKARGLSRSIGHAEGIKGLRELITASVRLGIPYLTAYAFSTENWNRPQEEVNVLMALFAEEVHLEMPLLNREDVKLRFIGDIDGLPQETRDSFYEGLELTKDHKGLELALAVNYGSRAEIARAAQKLADKVGRGLIGSQDITPELLERELDTYGMPDPDLMIRSSGELRLSNFMLWQLAYSEFYVTDVLWPDFTRFDLVRALLSYQKRERRYGGLVSNA